MISFSRITDRTETSKIQKVWIFALALGWVGWSGAAEPSGAKTKIGVFKIKIND